jgi:hypothetical protein
MRYFTYQFILISLILLTNCAVNENQSSTASANEKLNDKTCIDLASNFASNFNVNFFIGNETSDLEVGGILVDYSKTTIIETEIPSAYKDADYSKDEHNLIHSLNGQNIHYIKINAVTDTTYIVMVSNDFPYKLGRFYKFNLNHMELNKYDRAFIKEITEVQQCSDNDDYKKFKMSQPNYKKYFFCKEDGDCIIRVNNNKKVRAYHKEDPVGIEWSDTVERGPPGHTIYPNPDNVLAYCYEGKCKIKFNCSRCDILKQKWGDCNNNYMVQTASLCELYNKCDC